MKKPYLLELGHLHQALKLYQLIHSDSGRYGMKAVLFCEIFSQCCRVYSLPAALSETPCIVCFFSYCAAIERIAKYERQVEMAAGKSLLPQANRLLISGFVLAHIEKLFINNRIIKVYQFTSALIRRSSFCAPASMKPSTNSDIAARVVLYSVSLWHQGCRIGIPKWEYVRQHSYRS